jgi:hypothetical protein
MVGWFMLFNATFNNISAISWQSVLLVEETTVHGEQDEYIILQIFTRFLQHVSMYKEDRLITLGNRFT